MRRWVVPLLVAAVLAAGVALTAASTLAVRRGEQRYAGQLMDRYADDVRTAVADRTQNYSDTLADLATGVGAQSSLTREDFASLTAGLTATRLPGVGRIALVVPVTSGDLEAVRAYWKAHGASATQVSSAPENHDLIVFEHVLDSQAASDGLDLKQIPTTAAALATARHSGAVAASAAHVIFRDQALPAAQRQPSVVFAAPVYAGLGSSAPDLFVGWIIMTVRGGDFLDRTLTDRAQGAVRVTLDDREADATVIAQVAPGVANGDGALVRDRDVTVGQRTWHMRITPTASLLPADDRRMAPLTLGAGLALTAMCAAMVGALAGSRNRAMDRVDRATAELREDIQRRTEIEARLREREEELRQLAFHDPLTGLANRTLFYDRVEHALTTHPGGVPTFAVLFIDLDGFKEVNDRYGHASGDTVLRDIAARLLTGLRAGDTVARLGGDEFAVLLERLPSAAEAETTAARIVAVAAQPIDVGGGRVAVSASVGIATNRPGDTADDILRIADSAMYAAKSSGKSQYVVAAN